MKPPSKVINNNNEVCCICQFCNDLCKNTDHSSAKDWWTCRNCNVKYKVESQLIQFRLWKNNKDYYLHISFATNISALYLYDAELGHYDEIVAFDHIVNVTPTSFPDKLRTILTFL